MSSLRSLTAIFIAAILLATGVAGYATYSASHATIDRLVDERIIELSASLMTGVQPGDAEALAARISRFAERRDSGDIGFELFDSKARRIGGNIRLKRPLPAGFSNVRRSDGIVGLTAGRALVRDIGDGVRLTIIAETEPIDGFNEAQRRNYLIGFGVVALILLVGTTGFGLLVRRRMGELQATAAAIIDGDMNSRVPGAEGSGAFARQAAMLNRMLDRIGQLMDGIRGVSSDVAHDLRTPLARLRNNLDQLAERTQDTGLERDVEAALDQCDDLLATFAAILRIAEIEGDDRRDALREVDLATLVDEVCQSMAALAEEGGHTLAAPRLTSLTVMGDHQLLSQALINLIENAFRHTPSGSTIAVSLEQRADAACLIVRDNGPGIAPADRPHALRRFGRLDRSRTRPGHGLGLSLVEAVAHFHRGDLTLDDARPGLIVTIILPAV